MPPGIGDISWIYSKLAGLGRPLRIEIADSGPRRALPYLDLLPLVKEAAYVKAANPAKMRLGKASPHWGMDDLIGLARAETVPIDLNSWLEAGNRIEGFMPEIPTVHHYEMLQPLAGPSDLGNILWLRNGHSRYISFYCANSDTVRRWHGWNPQQWSALADMLMQEYDLDGIALLGAEWDRPFAEKVLAATDVMLFELVGKSRLAVTLDVLRRSLYLVAFPSGIPILATVMSRPTVMFYPDSLTGLMTSWVPPDVLQDGTYKAMHFCDPQQVFEWIRDGYGLAKRKETLS